MGLPLAAQGGRVIRPARGWDSNLDWGPEDTLELTLGEPGRVLRWDRDLLIQTDLPDVPTAWKVRTESRTASIPHGSTVLVRCKKQCCQPEALVARRVFPCRIGRRLAAGRHCVCLATSSVTLLCAPALQSIINKLASLLPEAGREPDGPAAAMVKVLRPTVHACMWYPTYVLQ